MHCLTASSSGISELVDAGAPEEIQKKITNIACNNPGVQEVHKVRTRYISTSIQVDLHIVVDGSISVRQGHAIADAVENQILDSIPNVLGVIIHVDPPDVTGSENENPMGQIDSI